MAIMYEEALGARLKQKAWLIVLAGVIAAGTAAYFLVYTSKGSEILTKSVLSRGAQADRVQFKEVSGNLAEGVTYHNVELTELEGLPEGAIVRIQKIFVSLTSFHIDGLTVSIENARLFVLPAEDPAVLWFSLKQGNINANFYTKSTRIQDILPFIPGGLKGRLTGTLTGIDLYLKGPYAEPQLTGSFHVENISSNGFSAFDCPGSVDLALKHEGNEVRPSGEVLVTGGTVSGPKTAALKLDASKALFSGDWEDPSLDINANASVEGAEISVSVKGTLKAPELKLSSQPALPQEKLLLMLATNRSWKGAESTFASRQISADLAKDFIDYFAFSGEGNAMAKRFGISDVSVKFEKETKGIGFTKDLSDRLKAKYGIEETRKAGESTSEITQRVGTEVKLTDTISAEAKKEVLPKTKNSSDAAAAVPADKPNDEILLKYKKSF